MVKSDYIFYNYYKNERKIREREKERERESGARVGTVG